MENAKTLVRSKHNRTFTKCPSCNSDNVSLQYVTNKLVRKWVWTCLSMCGMKWEKEDNE